MAPGFAGPQSQSRVSAPSVVRLKNGRLRMYFWATWPEATITSTPQRPLPKNPYDWKLVREEPVLGPSPNWEYQRQGTQLSLGDSAGRRHLAHVLRHLGILGAVR